MHLKSKLIPHIPNLCNISRCHTLDGAIYSDCGWGWDGREVKRKGDEFLQTQCLCTQNLVRGSGQRETEGEKDIKCSNQNEKWSRGYFKQELIHHKNEWISS